MERKQSRSRSAEQPPIPLTARVLSFFLDWSIWGYIAYGTVYLLNHYWYVAYIDWYGRLTLPWWGWPVVVIATFELALLSHSFGHSLGMRAMGLMPAAEGLDRPALRKRRLRHFLASHISIMPLGIGVWASPSEPWHERLSGLRLVRLPQREEWITPPPRWYRTEWGIMTLAILGLTVTLGWHVTGIHLRVLIAGAARPARLWQGLTHPDFTFLIYSDPWLNDSIVGALIESIFMALLATIFGAGIAFVLSFFGARNIMAGSLPGLIVYGLTRGVFNIFRSIESILWALIFAVWVGWGPFAGTLALFIHTIAALGKLYSEQTEHIDPGPLEAIAATGGSRIEVIRYGVVPQIVPPFLAFTLYRWDINVRMATVVALVGGGGIGRLFFYYKDQLDWAKVGAIIVAIGLVVWLLDYISGRVREKIV
ncbi:MAG: phosphonate ABC transporter, permease protein PhnE [Candidatus Acetothermia bacterium]|jgi:phosphonate transport system permease protein|nr:phosphonate ABC transporter, permease protein PhnE [Candidatus Acetothermia bacterium]MDH7506020.1 phosphonate ABC transporter, permease protein PhnE [Candidatus Acetothermia bacterium]